MKIWKASLRETRSRSSILGVEMKNVLMYYKFGSSKKHKEKNYLMELRDRLENEFYDLKTYGTEAKNWGGGLESN
jgi:hypothetical protein